MGPDSVQTSAGFGSLGVVTVAPKHAPARAIPIMRARAMRRLEVNHWRFVSTEIGHRKGP